MNERGIFNIIGLCLLLVVAISITGVHDTESNFSHNMSDLQMERDLKHAADSGLVMAVKKVRNAYKNTMTIVREFAKGYSGDPYIKKKAVSKIESLNLIRDEYGSTSEKQKKILDTKIDSGQLKNVSVEVWAEIGDINEFEILNYSNIRNNKFYCEEYFPKRDGIVLMSVAKYDENYQSSMAYLLYDEDNNGNYEYEYKINYINGTNLTLDENTVKKNHLQE